ncbi:SDR family NAD(P)-dependent oxidoreductase [Paenibacillus sp. J2TS4]|uniref:SDR family oxidoreductase n=1 Tax=Paenibacillus sp. J2TS4 TaxID=2807194 RepID=UPI001BCA8F3B|nr:SDR family NAD(P)-dependent oxidoreductase [Paenibacillus sp. J2TS4]
MENDAELAGRVALVTGAGSGIGKAAAIQLAEAGASIGAVDLHEGELAEVCHEIEQNGGRALPIPADVADGEEMNRAAQLTVKSWGRLDCVFANAGINGMLAPIEELSIEHWNRTIGTNLSGTFHTVKAAIPYLKNQGGSIIITSSVNGNRVFSNIGMSAYSTSKAGQVAFMKMAALELAQYRIRVNAICPGSISTNIGESTIRSSELEDVKIPVEYPEGRHPLEQGPGCPEQVADLVLFLASDRSSHITGTAIYIDGAESLLK